MDFGKILRDLRGEKTQEEIAKAVGITKSSWAMYERGERIPRDEVKIRHQSDLRELSKSLMYKSVGNLEINYIFFNDA